MIHKEKLLTFLVCAIAIPMIGCHSTRNQTKVPFSAPATITIAEAETLVKDWDKIQKDQFYWRISPKLKEVTTKDISESLHAQVFQLKDYTGSVTEFDAYLIKDRNVYPMSIGFGGFGLMDMSVCDIDGDSKDELVYTFSWGSGMHRSEVEAYRFDGSSATKIKARFCIPDFDLSFGGQDGHNLIIYTWFYTRADLKPKKRIGELVFIRSGNQEYLDIKLDPEQKKNEKTLIWRINIPKK
jgi:hypothetical protein